MPNLALTSIPNVGGANDQLPTGPSQNQQLPATSQGSQLQGTQPPSHPTPQTQTKTFTQDQVDEIFNKRWGEKLGAIEKEIGVSIKDAKAIIESHHQRLDSEKTELQRATDRATELEQELAAFKLKDTITSELLAAGASPKKISKLALRILGETPEEIKADIADLKKEFPQMFGLFNGGDHPGVQDVKSSVKTWKASEIRAMTHSERVANEAEILSAMRDGRVVMD